MTPTPRRYRNATNRSAALEPQILAALDGRWQNTAAVCKAVGVWSDHCGVRYALKRLTDGGAIERRRGGDRGITFLYRRKP